MTCVTRDSSPISSRWLTHPRRATVCRQTHQPSTRFSSAPFRLSHRPESAVAVVHVDQRPLVASSLNVVGGALILTAGFPSHRGPGSQSNRPLPTTCSGFRDRPLCALAGLCQRHVQDSGTDPFADPFALSLLGLDLDVYLTKGYDCPLSRFTFSGLPPYRCPVEIKKQSARFDYQILHYADLPRAVVLCIEHDLVNPPDHVDVVELTALGEYLSRC